MSWPQYLATSRTKLSSLAATATVSLQSDLSLLYRMTEPLPIAWVMGAADPTSGTVSLHEIIRGYGALLRQGWKPLRTSELHIFFLVLVAR